MEHEILRVGVRKCGVSGFKSVGRESARGERMGIREWWGMGDKVEVKMWEGEIVSGER